jgi:hypothetical protein
VATDAFAELAAAKPVEPADAAVKTPVPAPAGPTVCFCSQIADFVVERMLQDTVTGVRPVSSTLAKTDGPCVTVMGVFQHSVLFARPTLQSSS